jgi:membrane-bound serine protease (ClpP class)
MHRFLALLFVGLIASAVSGSVLAQAERPDVVVGEIKGIINPVMAGYVDRVISDAERSNAAAIVFYMDTPGGLSEAMREINLRILASRAGHQHWLSHARRDGHERRRGADVAGDEKQSDERRRRRHSRPG